MKFKITPKDLTLAVVFAIMGFIFSERSWIQWMNSLNPIEGLFVYYIILYTSLFILSKLTLVVFGFRITNISQTFGLLLITFAFFILVNWVNPYVQYITTGSLSGASNVFYQCEDGATWYFWNTIVGIKDIETARILTYSVTTFILTLIGAGLVSGNIKLLGG
jgi:hypothetical protein